MKTGRKGLTRFTLRVTTMQILPRRMVYTETIKENMEAELLDADQAEGEPAGEQVAPDAATPRRSQQQHDH